jgi:hypothetical protein
VRPRGEKNEPVVVKGALRESPVVSVTFASLNIWYGEPVPVPK